MFLTHDWGTDGEGRRTHERVAAVNRALKARGLRTHFDEDRLQGNVVDKMCAGIDDSDVIVVFVSSNYIDKVCGKAGPQVREATRSIRDTLGEGAVHVHDTRGGGERHAQQARCLGGGRHMRHSRYPGRGSAIKIDLLTQASISAQTHPPPTHITTPPPLAPSQDNCKREFEYAERTKGADRLLSVVMEPAVRDTRAWRGGVGMVLGSRPFIDLMSGEEGSGEWEAGVQALHAEVLKLQGVNVAGAVAGGGGGGSSAAAAGSSRTKVLPAGGGTQAGASHSGSVAAAGTSLRTHVAESQQTMVQKVIEIALPPTLPELAPPVPGPPFHRLCPPFPPFPACCSSRTSDWQKMLEIASHDELSTAPSGSAPT